MKITFQADDGHAGGARPLTVTVPDDELKECEDSNGQEQLIDQYVDDAFRAQVTYFWDRKQLSKCPKPEGES